MSHCSRSAPDAIEILSRALKADESSSIYDSEPETDNRKGTENRDRYGASLFAHWPVSSIFIAQHLKSLAALYITSPVGNQFSCVTSNLIRISPCRCLSRPSPSVHSSSKPSLQFITPCPSLSTLKARLFRQSFARLTRDGTRRTSKLLYVIRLFRAFLLVRTLHLDSTLSDLINQINVFILGSTLIIFCLCVGEI